MTPPSRSIPSCALVAVALALFGLACDDECKKGNSECVSDSLIRACVPGDDGPEWFVHACGEQERCQQGGAAAVAVASGDGGQASSGEGAICAGTCEVGHSECVAEAVARYCVDGRGWELDPCEAGQRCVDGSCRYTDGGVQVCAPGARTCASDRIERVCDRAGSGWVERECDEAEQCLVDRCAPNPDASCDVESRCLDNKTALRCLGEDRGFQVVECSGDTFCEDGRCRGDVCAIGSLCGAGDQVVECVDGESLTHSQCGVNEACKQERDWASCVPKPCEPDRVVCGDPRDPDVDDTRYYTQCKSGEETSSGLPEWVVGQCTGLLTCDPASALSGQPCQQQCTPGAQACMADPDLGISDGWAECQDDGTWGTVANCNVGGGLRQQCVIEPNLVASDLPVAQCVDPVCGYVIELQDGEGGACSEGRIQRCDADGKLQAPEDCEVGFCRATTAAVLSDGRTPGACDTEVECEEGEERCLFDSLIPSTRYQVCEQGHWSAKLETCTDDGQCLEYVDAEGLSKKVCGADCTPGEKRCNISDQVETCDDSGKWGGGSSCETGVCALLGDTPGKRDAACILECVPGERRCTGATVAASDGVSSGTSQEAVCGDDGLLGAPTDCAAGSACRVSSAGVHTGCVECVGPNVLGGNQWGYMDTRCDPAASTQVQDCGGDNTWLSSRACSAGTSCRMVNGSSCGLCNIGGLSMPCTDSNWATQQLCGSCLVNGSTVVCTETNVVAYSSPTSTCMSLFGDGTASAEATYPDGTTSWGGYLNCCDGDGGGGDGQFLQTSSCVTSGWGTPTAAGGYDDCCSTRVVAGVGAAFAYCDLAL
ncbi:MAG: hypothetical protein OEZ06_14115 [Myxococcales bacterium]|nr:hypothetical protein [Myxococcales bacterium]